MKENKIAKVYEEVAEKIKKSIFNSVYNDIWRSSALYFLRYLDFKKHDKILKLDLWDETIADFLSIRNSLITILKPEQIYYIEISKLFCKKFKKKFNSNFEYPTNGNIINLPFKNNSLDVVIDVSTSDQVQDKEFAGVIAELNRVLKRGGYLILFCLNNEYFNIENYKKQFNFTRYSGNIEQIEYILRENNFKTIKKRYFFPFIVDTGFISSVFHIRFLFLLSKLFGDCLYIFLQFLPSVGSKNNNSIIGYLIKK